MAEPIIRQLVWWLVQPWNSESQRNKFAKVFIVCLCVRRSAWIRHWALLQNQSILPLCNKVYSVLFRAACSQRTRKSCMHRLSVRALQTVPTCPHDVHGPGPGVMSVRFDTWVMTRARVLSKAFLQIILAIWLICAKKQRQKKNKKQQEHLDLAFIWIIM